jgi:isocitrate dehydrogenase
MSQESPITVAHGDSIGLRMLDHRGTIVWPGGMAETFVIDSYRCLFHPAETAASKTVTHAQVTAAGYDVVETETLHTFDGQQGLTLAQGQ